MTTHEIISATENPCGGVSLTIRWSAGTTTTQYYGSEAAKALGWKRPDPQPVDPAWMVEVAREVCAQRCERHGLYAAAAEYRSGRADEVEIETIVAALNLALSRGHVVLAPVMPSEEEMLKAAREDVRQVNEKLQNYSFAARAADGELDDHEEVRCALQARRNVYASLGAVPGQAVSSGPVVPEVDLREALAKAWRGGYSTAANALAALCDGEGDATTLYANEREKDLDAILENLKSGEA